MAIKPGTLQAVNKVVYARFPEVQGVQPKVQLQAIATTKVGTSAASAAPTYLLIYTAQARASVQRTIPRWVRVVVNDQGKILKMSTSR